MKKTTFKIAKMDCPSEEQMIRMKLGSMESIQNLQFDIPNRKLTVIHNGTIEPIESSIHTLKLDAKKLKTEVITDFIKTNDRSQKKILIVVLLINFALFLIEITTGFISHSMGLVADSLDMLADSIVYGLSLYAIGSTVRRKHRVAKTSGYLQLALAIFGFVEVIRRFTGYGEIPIFQTMIIISIIALIGNAVSLMLLQKQKSNEAHMKASWIFTTNDIVVNIGVIIAGVLVFVTKSRIPDLAIGSIVFIVVARGAFRILKL